MKRTRAALLVSYDESSSSENDKEHEPERPTPPPSKKTKKRKLPALPAHLAPAAPPDDPSKHQGRTRTTPHVDGQWAAYVYVPLALRAALRRVVARAVDIARGEADVDVAGTSVHVLGNGGGGDAGEVADVHKLHVSLTWPFFLRESQREEMKRAVRDAAKAHPP